MRAETFKECFQERYKALPVSATVDFFRPIEIAGEGPYMVEEMLAQLREMKHQEEGQRGE